VVCPDEAIYDHLGNLCDNLKASAAGRSLTSTAVVRRLRVVRVGPAPFDALQMVRLMDGHHFEIAEVITK